ncbi:MAG: hypothetical protein ACTSXL_05860 [Alphaproteobacteria bacterium]
MKLNKAFIFSVLGGFLIAGLFSTSIYARGKGSRQNTKRYSGAGSYSSNVITQNQNYVATTDTGGTGIGSNPLGGATCDNEGLCAKCKRLVRQSLQSYCRENECSKASNAFIIAKALPLSSTVVNIDSPLYDSPSTSVNQPNPVVAQGQGYDQTLVQSCQPYLVKNVEDLLPAYYDIVTEECHTQYKTAIEHYMGNNIGGFKMGSTGEKGAIRNFEILEYFKLHTTHEYDQSLYQDTSSDKYFFSAYCSVQMADSVKIALIDTHIPDIFTYQRKMCQRSYEMAMQAHCDGAGSTGCQGELDYMAMVMNKAFISEIRSDETQINCATELSQDVREALIEEVVRKQNMCSRQTGQYNAEQDKCMFNIALIDAKEKEIERKMYFEGETVNCNEKDFVDPYSKIGRKRAGATASWFRSKAGASVIYGTGGAVLGAVVGGGVGKTIAKKTKINQAMENAGVPETHRDVMRGKVTGLTGDILNDGTPGSGGDAVEQLVMDGFDETDAEGLIRELYDINAEGTPAVTTDDTVGRFLASANTAKRVGQAVGAVAGGAGAVAGTSLVYNKLYKETKCYKTWRSSRLGDGAGFGTLEATDRVFIDWGKSKALPRITEGLEVELDSLPTYDREYKGDPKWEDK